MSFPRRVVVVGGSAAGLGTAESLRRLGFDGEVTVVADETGDPYDRPPLSKKILAGQWSPDRAVLRTIAQIEDLDIKWLGGRRAVGVDVAERMVAVEGGAELGYDELVIATGLRARRPAGLAGARAGQLHVLRTLDDAVRLKEALHERTSVAVVGAGFIGTEVAATAAELGHRVELIDPVRHPLGTVVGPEVGIFLAGIHQSKGVNVRCGVSVLDIEETADGLKRIQLTDGSVVEARVVVLALGSTPTTDWLAGSRLDLSDGVICDARLVAAPGVSAVGDVASPWRAELGRHTRVEHRLTATEQAMFAAQRLVNGDGGGFSATPYFWSDQHGLRIQGHGWLRADDVAHVVDGSVTDGRFVVAHSRGGRVVGVLGVGMPKQLRKAKSWVEENLPVEDLLRPETPRVSNSAVVD